MNSDRLTFDSRQSVRSIDTNGFMHIAVSPHQRANRAVITAEIPGWESLGLDPNKTYMGYRPAEELKKPETIASFNGIPLQFRHHADFAEGPSEGHARRRGGHRSKMGVTVPHELAGDLRSKRRRRW